MKETKKPKYGDPARYPEFQDKQTDAVVNRFNKGLDKTLAVIVSQILNSDKR